MDQNPVEPSPHKINLEKLLTLITSLSPRPLQTKADFVEWRGMARNLEEVYFTYPSGTIAVNLVKPLVWDLEVVNPRRYSPFHLRGIADQIRCTFMQKVPAGQVDPGLNQHIADAIKHDFWATGHNFFPSLRYCKLAGRMAELSQSTGSLDNPPGVTDDLFILRDLDLLTKCWKIPEAKANEIVARIKMQRLEDLKLKMLAQNQFLGVSTLGAGSPLTKTEPPRRRGLLRWLFCEG